MGDTSNLQKITDSNNGRNKKCSKRVDTKSEWLDWREVSFNNSYAFFDTVRRDDYFLCVHVFVDIFCTRTSASDGHVSPLHSLASPIVLNVVLSGEESSKDNGENDQENAGTSV